MLILYTEDYPHSSTADLRQTDEEGYDSRVLYVCCVDRVKDPVEANDRVDNHRNVVGPRAFVGKCLAQKFVLCVRIQQTPIHDDIPEAAVDSINGSAEDEECFVGRAVVETIHAKAHVVKYCAHILAAVHKVRKRIPGVLVTSQTLECSPYTGQCTEKAKQSRV